VGAREPYAPRRFQRVPTTQDLGRLRDSSSFGLRDFQGRPPAGAEISAVTARPNHANLVMTAHRTRCQPARRWRTAWPGKYRRQRTAPGSRVRGMAALVATSRSSIASNPSRKPRNWTPVEASTRAVKVEGSVDCKIRGGSSPLGRMRTSPAARGFLMFAYCRRFCTPLDVVLPRGKYVHWVGRVARGRRIGHCASRRASVSQLARGRTVTRRGSRPAFVLARHGGRHGFVTACDRC
jgi:hypothetical protein